MKRTIAAISMAAASLALAHARGPEAGPHAETPAPEAASPVIAPLAPFVPSALSAADRDLYERIFDLQERGRFSEAAKLFAQVEDKTLEGWVRHQKLMHPTAYRSRYTELKDFMEAHPGHPHADDVYRLALYRRPKNWRRPPPPTGRSWRAEAPEAQTEELAAAYEGSYSRRRAVRRIEGRVRYLLRKDRPTQSLKELNYRSNRAVLEDVQYDRIRSWIAASYYYNQVYDKAREISEEVAAAHGDSAVLSYWIAGLVSWREGDAERGADHFAAMAEVEEQDPWLRSAAGYWASRTALAAGRADGVVKPLLIAANYPYTFYGQLARATLGQSADAPAVQAPLTKETLQALMIASPRVRTAIALAEAGQSEEADLELRWAMGETPAEHDRELLAVASALKLASAEIDIAEDAWKRSGRAEFEAGLYPIPDLAPAGGYIIDRALAFALMRQESRFRTDARSRAGARGLMQLMPRTASYIANDRTYVYRSGREKLYDPAVNIHLGQTYVDYLFENHVDGDLLQMAVAYNGGPGNLRRWKARIGAENDPLLFIESIPNPESRDYVERVLTNLWIYRARFDQPAPSLEALARGEWPKYVALDEGA